jgi:hypothetical protein
LLLVACGEMCSSFVSLNEGKTGCRLFRARPAWPGLHVLAVERFVFGLGVDTQRHGHWPGHP